MQIWFIKFLNIICLIFVIMWQTLVISFDVYHRLPAQFIIVDSLAALIVIIVLISMTRMNLRELKQLNSLSLYDLMYIGVTMIQIGTTLPPVIIICVNASSDSFIWDLLYVIVYPLWIISVMMIFIIYRSKLKMDLIPTSEVVNYFKTLTVSDSNCPNVSVPLNEKVEIFDREYKPRFLATMDETLPTNAIFNASFFIVFVTIKTFFQ